MSWIRISSSNGLRLFAPSVSPPPLLEGFESLFHPPLSIREIHCFTPARSGWEEEQDEEVVVIMREVHLGGRVGDACIAAGGPNYTAEALEVLLENTKMLLRSTSENGLQMVLDALCTRSPLRMDMRSYVLEPDDGVALMGTERVIAERLLMSSTVPSLSVFDEEVAISSSHANRRFLHHLLSRSRQDRYGHSSDPQIGGDSNRVALISEKETSSPHTSGGGGGETTVALSQGPGERTTTSPSPSFTPCVVPRQHAGVQPPTVEDDLACSQVVFKGGKPSSPTVTTTPRDVIASTVTEHSPQGCAMANFLAKTLTRQVHYLRRRTLLYFLQWDTVPLSLFSSRVRPVGRRKIVIPTTGLLSASSSMLRKGSGGGGESKRSGSAGSVSQFGAGADLTPLMSQPWLSVMSLLRRSKRLQDPKSVKTILWRELMETSEELGPLLLLAVQRTLCCTFPHHADFFGKEMWCKPHRSTVHTPLFAAYSASGLLLGSGAFYHVLHHRERYIVSAVAMNALASAPLSRPYSFARTADPITAKPPPQDWRIHLQQFPLAVSHPTAGADTIDFCVWRIGDALAVAVGISRVVQKQRGLHLQTLVEALTNPKYAPLNGLSSTTSCFSTFAGSAYMSMLAYTLHVLCHHNLSPTQEYYAAVCTLNALERGVYYDSNRGELNLRVSLRDSLERSGAGYYYDANLSSAATPGYREVGGRDSVSENQRRSRDVGRAASSSPPALRPMDPLARPVLQMPAATLLKEEEDHPETAVGCVCCLPFSRRKKASDRKQELFIAERAKLGQQKVAVASSQLERNGTMMGSHTPLPRTSSVFATPSFPASSASPFPAPLSSSTVKSAPPVVPVSRVKLQFLRSLLLLHLSPSAMWYYVASRASVAEGLAFRSLEGTAVHSAFWLQQVPPMLKGSSTWTGTAAASTAPSGSRSGSAASDTQGSCHVKMASSAHAQYCVGFFRPRVEHGTPDGTTFWLQHPGATVEWAIRGTQGTSFAGTGGATSVTVFPMAALEEVVSSPLHAWNTTSSHASSESLRLAKQDLGLLPTITPFLPGEEMEEEGEEEAPDLLTSLYQTTRQVLRVKKYKRSKKKAASLRGSSVPIVDEDDDEDSNDVILGEMGEQEGHDEQKHSHKDPPFSSEEKKHGQSTTKGSPSSSFSVTIQIAEVVNLFDDWRGEEKNVFRVLEKQRLPKAFSTRREPDLFDAPKCEDAVRDLCEELALCKEAVTTLFHGALVH